MTGRNSSITVNVYTDGATGHANVTFNGSRGGITVGANQEQSKGRYQYEMGSEFWSRPTVSTTYQTTPEQYQHALDYVNSLLGTGYFYGIEAICTTFVSQIYGMTRTAGMPPEWGFLFTPAQIEEIRKATLVDLAIPGVTNPGPMPCFPAGTLISTPRGPVPIEKIRPGDIVLSFNPGCVVPKKAKRPRRVRYRGIRP